MKRYLLDTDILSYFVKGIHPTLQRRMARGFQNDDIAISVVTRAEMRYGQELMLADDKRRTRVDLLLSEMPTLPWTTAAADHYGQVKALLKRQGTPIGEMDTQIAAHALAEGLILVTHNARHFKNVPRLKLQDWVA